MTEEKRKELEERKDNALDLFLDAWLTDVFMLMTDRQLDDVKEEIERHISIRRHLKAIPDCMVTETDIWYMNQEKLEERKAQNGSY